jgi:hypothetical protein
MMRQSSTGIRSMTKWIQTKDYRIDFTIYDTVTNQSFADYEYIEATDREDMLTEFNLIMDVDWPEDRYEVSINRIHEDV